MASDTPIASEGRTRQEKTKRLFITADGEATPRTGLESVAGKIIFVETGEELEFKWDDLTPEIQRAAGLFGIMTSVTNTVGRAGMSAAEMVEAAETRLEYIQGGQWSADRQSGPRTSDFIEAAARWYAEKGKPFDEDMRARMQAKLADEEAGAEYKADLLSRPSFKALFEAIKAERAAARAEKAKAAAASAEVESDDLDL